MNVDEAADLVLRTGRVEVGAPTCASQEQPLLKSLVASVIVELIVHFAEHILERLIRGGDLGWCEKVSVRMVVRRACLREKRGPWAKWCGDAILATFAGMKPRDLEDLVASVEGGGRRR